LVIGYSIKELNFHFHIVVNLWEAGLEQFNGLLKLEDIKSNLLTSIKSVLMVKFPLFQVEANKL